MHNYLKKIIGGFLIFIIIIILVTLKLPPHISSQVIPLSIFIILFIMVISFKDEINEIMSVLSLAVILTLLIGLVFCWIFQIPIPYTSYNMTDSTIIAFFTVILAFATIINVIIYRKSLDLARMTNIKIIINNSLDIQIINEGNFTARRLKVEMRMIDKMTPKEKQNIVQRFKDTFLPLESPIINFLMPGEKQFINFKDSIKERFNLKDNINSYGEDLGYITKRKRDKKDFKLIISVKYYTDILSRVPFPSIRKVRVKIDNKEMNIIREGEMGY